MKRLLFSLILLTTLPVHAWTLPDVIECTLYPGSAKEYNCTLKDVPSRLPYRMDDGTTKVLSSTIPVGCREGICEIMVRIDGRLRYTEEYAGEVDTKKIIFLTIHRGYYVGMSLDGGIVAYAMGTGPAYGGAAASTPTDPAIDACVQLWSAEYRKEVGQDAMVSYDQILEYERMCREGETP